MYRDFKRSGGTVTYEVTENTLYLQEIVCERGKGREVMNMFLNYVKTRHKRVTNIYLEAFTSYGVPLDSLVRFYRSFGFIPESGVLKAADGQFCVKMRLLL